MAVLFSCFLASLVLKKKISENRSDVIPLGTRLCSDSALGRLEPQSDRSFRGMATP